MGIAKFKQLGNGIFDENVFTLRFCTIAQIFWAKSPIDPVISLALGICDASVSEMVSGIFFICKQRNPRGTTDGNPYRRFLTVT